MFTFASKYKKKHKMYKKEKNISQHAIMIPSCWPKLVAVLVLLVLGAPLSAQDLSVRSMELVPNDATAAMEDFQLQDLNDNYAGVVKVHIALEGVTFDGGGLLKQEKRDMGEYWVWLAKDSKRLTVRAPGFLPLEVNFFNDYRILIESKRTYKLVVTAPKGESAQMQKLTLRYSPSDATVIIDDEVVEGRKGVIDMSLPVGEHNYSIAKKGYGVDKGTFTLIANAPKRLTVELEKLQETPPVTPVTTTNTPVARTVQTAETVSPPAQDAQQVVASSNQPNASTGGSKTFDVNGVNFTMVHVQGGTFTMGATSEQGSDAYKDEKPAHSVTLSDYYIGETEVTQSLWKAVMGSLPSGISSSSYDLEGAQRAVCYVSWDDCQTFLSRLNSLTGQHFKLPTEVQWEYAARGGNKSRGSKYSGSVNVGEVAWYTGNTSAKGSRDVKTKQPNELGLYDMSGNVDEWCQDWRGDYSSGSQTNPTGPAGGSLRVIRGGGWIDIAWVCRVSDRGYFTPSSRGHSLGLRLAL